MNKLLKMDFNPSASRTAIGLLASVFGFVLLIVAQDFLRANLRNSGFYLSESILFSTFWWLFAPLLLAQYAFIKRSPQAGLQALVMIAPIVLHVLVFPAFVWVISSLFYQHTFAFQQTVTYELSEHSYLLVLVYAVPVLTYPYAIKQRKAAVHEPESQAGTSRHSFIRTLLISEAGKKRPISVQDILYFSAMPPYIGIHTDEKKYVYTDTLKSISAQLSTHQFVRVHKSTIVNLRMVVSYASRLNGDYDLLLTNKTKLRLSRNFAADFKQKFEETHPLTP